MTRNVKWSASTALIVVLLFLAAWFLLISPKRAEAASLQEQTASRDAANVVLQQKIAVLKVQAQDLPKQRARLDAIQVRMPPAPALPTLLREVDKAAKTSGVFLRKLNPVAPKSREVGSAVAVVPSPAGQAPATAGPYLQEIQLVIEAGGDFAQLADFLNRLEDLKRSLLTVGVIVEADTAAQPKAEDGKLVVTDKLKMTLTSSVFIATPGSPAATTGAAPAAAPAAVIPTP